MKTLAKSALTLCSFLALIGAHAEEGSAPAGNGEGVVGKVEHAVTHGVKTAAEGVEKGVGYAARGVEKGAHAAAHGIEVGANATARVVKRVANKVGGSGNSASESAGKGEAESASK